MKNYAWLRKMNKTSQITIITSYDQFEFLYPIVTVSQIVTKKGQPFKKQSIQYIELRPGAEPTLHSKVLFRLRGIECDGPILPYQVSRDGKDMSVKRPMIKTCATKESEHYDLFLELDLRIRAAYMLTETHLAEAFTDILTFFPLEVELKPDAYASSSSEKAYQVMVITKKYEILPLDDIFKNMKAEQKSAYERMKSTGLLQNKDCILEDDKAEKITAGVFVFSHLKPRIHEKSGRIYYEMNLSHTRFPDGPDGKPVEKYFSPGDDRPGIADINQWGIRIPILQYTSTGGYAMIKGSNWVEEEGFKPVTSARETNKFIGTIGFFPDQVMMVSTQSKTWWRIETICKQPEPSHVGGSPDYGEDEVEPEGTTSSLKRLMFKAPPAPAPSGSAEIDEDGDM
jgi:hypothetical protein